MKYILLNAENVVLEIIPEENPDLPGVMLDERYSKDFVEKLLPVGDDVEVEQNWLYNPDNVSFSPPVIEDDPDPDLTDAEALAIILGGETNA